jgi:hypothetical protein
MTTHFVGFYINLKLLFRFAPIITSTFINRKYGKRKNLVIGASGQIGVELTLALRKIYGMHR